MAQTRKLYRSKTDRKLAGVCGGLAQYFNMDATLIRVLFVVLAVLGGSGLVLYLAIWFLVPTSRKPSGPSWPRLGPGYGGLDQESADLALRLLELCD